MEHSASILDISSDDDIETKMVNEDLERGKENIPPPEWVVAQQARLQARASMSIPGAEQVDVDVEEPVKRPRLRTFVQDAMDEDRKPLGDLPPSEYYGEGCDASSYVTVDAGIEKPSGLSRECDFSIAVDEETKADETPVVQPTLDVKEQSASKVTPENVAVCVNEPVVAIPISQDATSPTLNTAATSSAHDTLDASS